MNFGKYQFLSWARRGIARNIIQPDTLGASPGNADERAQIPISVKVNTNINYNEDYDLIGPGDIIGIQNKMIIRTDPLNGIPDFEPNLLPYVEFYDEDFPWRYTPAAPTGQNKRHSRPWLALIVLKENEFLDTERRTPLASIKIGSADYLPPADQLHLWAHMHSNLPNEQSEFAEFLDSLEEDVKTDPDGVYSRLICPRKLEAKVMYHAFLVPAFETGRLAGLGRPTTGVKAQQHSFGSDLEFPIYHRWYFRTGQNFDFEYLVKLLQPRAMDERVGVRPMDCSKPAFIQADVDAEVEAPNPEIMLLEGALKAPNASSTKFPPNNTPQPFFEQLKKLIDLNLFQEENPNEDPFVSIPYYGQYHSVKKNNALPGKVESLPFDPNLERWYNDLNRDPRTRIAAGFGARVVQKNQEKFMDAAWDQLEDVQEANQKMKLFQFTATVLEKTYEKYVAFRSPDNLLKFSEKLNQKILKGSITVRAEISRSLIPNQLFQASFSKLLRRNTSLNKGLQINQTAILNTKLVTAMNKPKGLKTSSPDKFVAIDKLKGIKTFTLPNSITKVKVWSTQSNLDGANVFNFKTFVGGLPTISDWKIALNPNVLVLNRPQVGNVVSTRIPNRTMNLPATNVSNTRINVNSNNPVLNQPGRNPALPNQPLPTNAIPTNPRTNIPTTRIPPLTGPVVNAPTRQIKLIETTKANNRLSLAQQNAAMKTSYNNFSFLLNFKETNVQKPTLATANIGKTVKDKIKPFKAFENLQKYKVKWPDGIFKIPNEPFIPAMAYPDFPEPVYKHLIDIDEEFLLPNLQLIPKNTLSLLRTNQKFIESYLMGLNYEMGKELMWREYPTDMRGSYFRQFWDVNGLVKPDTSSEDANDLKDIEPIHKWRRSSKLGTHNQRDKDGNSEQLVFVIKGELLKKFPNTVIYAQKAIKEDDKQKIRMEMTEAQFAKEVRFPLYQAEIKPDIKLLGFDLTIEEASGQDPTDGFTDELGWFFVIAEVPGEPHFGMDVSFKRNTPDEFTWNDLSWKNFEDNLPFVNRDIQPGNTSSATFNPPNDPKKGTWGRSSADMASILFQRPVMVPVHATEMLDVKVPVMKANVEEFMTLLQYVKL